MSSNYTKRIGLCTDTHYRPHDPKFSVHEFGHNGSAQLLHISDQLQNVLISELQNASLDLVLHLGDQTCGGGTFDLPMDEFYKSVDYCYAKFSQLDTPIYTLQGNHDCPPGGGNWSYFEKQWGLQPNLGTTIDLPEARLILLNTHGHSAQQIEAAKPYDTVYGLVHDLELERLERELATAGNRPVLLFCHQLLRSWAGPHQCRKFYHVRNAEEILDILSKQSNVRAVFQAHAHRLDVHTAQIGQQETTFIVLPSIIEYPIAWTQLELTAAQLQITMRQLPLPHLAEQSRAIVGKEGTTQDWRIGQPEWHNMVIDL